MSDVTNNDAEFTRLMRAYSPAHPIKSMHEWSAHDLVTLSGLIDAELQERDYDNSDVPWNEEDPEELDEADFEDRMRDCEKDNDIF